MVLLVGTFVTLWQLVGKWSIYIVALLIDTLRSYPEKNFNNFSRGNFNSDGRNHLDPGWINGHSGKSIRVSASSNATRMDRFFWKIKLEKQK